MINTLSAVILCGGKSRRMGTDKARLTLSGETVLSHLVKNMKDIDDLWLSISTDESYPEVRIRKISDRYPDCGPLGGLEAALTVCQKEYLFVTPVDTPFADAGLACEMFSVLEKSPETDVVLMTDSEGRKQNLLGIYRKRILPNLRENLIQGKLRVKDLLESLVVRYLSVDDVSEGAAKTVSCNTPEEYTYIRPEIQNEQNIPVISVTGWSGSGKTTWLERMIPALCKKGLRIAVLKHDAHQFEIDKDGKDTWRLSKAGTVMTGIISSQKAAWMENRRLSLDRMLQQVHDADLVLLEGGSMTKYPKILVYRKEAGKELRVNPCECLAVITDEPKEEFLSEKANHVPVFSPENIEESTHFLCQYLQQWRTESCQNIYH